jgi:hypothetical protein
MLVIRRNDFFMAVISGKMDFKKTVNNWKVAKGT